MVCKSKANSINVSIFVQHTTALNYMIFFQFIYVCVFIILLIFSVLFLTINKGFLRRYNIALIRVTDHSNLFFLINL